MIRCEMLLTHEFTGSDFELERPVCDNTGIYNGLIMNKEEPCFRLVTKKSIFKE